MKKTRKKIILALIAAVVLGIASLVILNLPKAMPSTDMAFDLSKIADGSYLGGCDNGPVRVQVSVEVENHAITAVQLLKHDNGMGSAAEVITETVVAQQSVEVDVISGATMSSKTILKAIEIALSEGTKN
ncbi:MAG: FMN-binding protein [Clostridia bacterium]|nr:FMN-binding protein [Clostridia bacterium]